MSIRGLENQLVLLLAAAGVLVASLVTRQFLPERFLLDDQHLQRAMSRGSLVTDAASFQDVAAAYRAVGLEHAAPLAGLLGVGLFTAAVIAAVGWDRLPQMPIPSLVMVIMVFVPALAYLGQYTKEVATLALVLLTVGLPGGRRRWAVLLADGTVVAACLVYGATLRPYWLIIGGVYVLWRLLLPRTAHPAALLAVPVVVYAVLQPMFSAVLGHGLQGQREWANAERADTAVTTLIHSVAPEATGILGVGAALVMTALMVVPAGLILTGSPFHLASGIAICCLWMLVLVPVLRGALVRRGPAQGPGPGPGPDGPGQVRAVRAASLILAFLLVQALFEPDYGSALKHLTPLLPLVLLVHLYRRSS